MNEQKKIIVIIPALNEEHNIGPIIEKIKKVMKEAFILVVNDGSMDSTRKKVLTCGAQIVNLPYTLGIGAAMQTGFIFAKENNFDIAIQIDGDGQHNPGEIPQLLKPILEGKSDLVIGSRYIEKKGDASTLQRRIGIKIFSLLLSKILKQKITDPTSGFRAVNRKVIDLFSNIYPEDYPEPESLVVLHINQFSIMETPVSMTKRASGVSSIGIFGSIYYMVKVILAILIDLCKKDRLKTQGGINAKS